jgi:hypothetical protein
MGDNETAVALTALIMAPGILWVLMRFRRDSSHRTPPPLQGGLGPDERQIVQRLEARIESLEMLLDSELPGWRSRSRV